jgi:glucose-6-phosphate 1-dehydrogenase
MDVAPPAEPAPPCILVIFGAAGDLARRLLLPSFCHLRQAKLLSEEFAVIGVARAQKDDESFRRELDASLRESGGIAQGDREWLLERTFYLRGEFEDPNLYQRLARLLAGVAATHGTAGTAIF